MYATSKAFAKYLLIAALAGFHWVQLSHASLVTVKIYKPDHSIQCRSVGIKLKDMERELTDQGIKVLSSCYGHDGLGRPAVCGASTGNLNVFEIPESQLQKAKRLGFGLLSGLPHARDQCKKPNSSFNPNAQLQRVG